MADKFIHHQAGKVTAKDGIVHLEGPDAVDVHLTPDAAEETSDALLHGVLKARGQAFFEQKKKRRD